MKTLILFCACCAALPLSRAATEPRGGNTEMEAASARQENPEEAQEGHKVQAAARHHAILQSAHFNLDTSLGLLTADAAANNDDIVVELHSDPRGTIPLATKRRRPSPTSSLPTTYHSHCCYE